MIKLHNDSNHQDRTILNMYESSNRTQSREAQMGNKKEEIDRFIITFEDFNTHLSLNDRITRKNTS